MKEIINLFSVLDAKKKLLVVSVLAALVVIAVMGSVEATYPPYCYLWRR